jgi:hypothetical protein
MPPAATNFVDGRCEGLLFDHFKIGKDAFDGGAGLSGKVTFSIRPQSLRPSRAPPERNGSARVEVTIIERAYLGELWDLPRSAGARLAAHAE